MKFILQVIFLFLLASCSSGSKPKPVESDLHQTLDAVSCPNADDFRGTGIGSNENDALAQARSNMAQEHFVERLKSSVDIDGQNIDGIASTSTRTSIIQNAKLLNPSDAKLHYSKRQGEQIGVVVCLTKADAAKGFAERLRPVADSLEFAAKGVIDAKHPKLKSEAWQKTKPLWDKFMGLYPIIQSLDREKSAPFVPVSTLYAKARDGYIDFCQTAKLYWNPEQNDIYSEIAFAKLSNSLKLEKAACKGNGISLIYKNSGCKCNLAGIAKCSHQPSLLIASCEGAEYQLLENQNIEALHTREEGAKEKLQEKLRNETFWNKWEQEIKQWRPICE